MTTKTFITIGFKWIFLAVLWVICLMVASAVTGLTSSDRNANPAEALLALSVIGLLFSAVWSYVILRSRWHGWRLVITVALVFYGIMTFLSQIETVVFLQYLVSIVPANMIPKLFAQGAVATILFSPIAVFVYGKMKAADEAPTPNARLVMPLTEWAWKLTVIAITYIVIYISFGMFVFIPLAGPAFQAYYGNLQMPVWILPFQAVRGLIWAALALPIIRMTKGAWWEAGLAVSLLFGLLMSALLITPNDLMPSAIRFGHFFELLSSNFVFGWIVVALLHRHHASWRELIPFAKPHTLSRTTAAH